MAEPQPLDEFQLIRRFFDRPSSDRSVRTGIGDDGAVLTPEPGRELVTVMDTLIEGVHFPGLLAPFDIGYRAVAVNLSDIAAMGARPRWMTLALTLDNADENWLQEFANGLFAAADAFGVSLVGGDTTRGKQKVISIQITGDVSAGKFMRRSGASPGDLIFVSGTVGDAAAGLSLIDDEDESTDSKRFLQNRFCRPTARVALGQALAGIATAAIDVSDGLFADAERLLLASEVAGVIEMNSLPRSAALRSLNDNEDALIRLALTGGDDYELCFAAAPENEHELAALADRLAVEISCIGKVQQGAGLTCQRDGKPTNFQHHGYKHF
jgi:thiamine-monophosphate kinase